MTEPTPCRVFIDGWRYAMIERGPTWDRVWTLRNRTHAKRFRHGAIETQEVDAETAKAILQRMGRKAT